MHTVRGMLPSSRPAFASRHSRKISCPIHLLVEMSISHQLSWALDALSLAPKEELQPFSRKTAQVFERLSMLLAVDSSTDSLPSSQGLGPFAQQPISQLANMQTLLPAWDGAAMPNQPEDIDMTAMPCWIESTASTSFQQSEDQREISLLEYSSASWVDGTIVPGSLSHSSNPVPLPPGLSGSQDGSQVNVAHSAPVAAPNSSNEAIRLPSCVSDRERHPLMEIDLSTHISSLGDSISHNQPSQTSPDNVDAQGEPTEEEPNETDALADERTMYSSNLPLEEQLHQDHGTSSPRIAFHENSTSAPDNIMPDEDAIISNTTRSDERRDTPAKPRSRDLSDILWERLKKFKTILESHLRKPMKSAVTDGASWHNEDVRVVDIKFVEGDRCSTFQSQFRRILAIRSLYQEFVRWRGPGSANSRSRSQNRFVTTGYFSDPAAVRRAVSVGQRLDAVEKKVGVSTVSLLIGTIFWEAQRASWDKIIQSVMRVKDQEYEFWNLLEEKIVWFEECQKYYSGMY